MRGLGNDVNQAPIWIPVMEKMRAGGRSCGKLLFDLWRKFRWKMILLSVVMAGCALLEGLTTALLLPLMNMIGVGDKSANAFSLKLERFFQGFGVPITLEAVIGLIVSLFLGQGLLVILQGRWIAQMETSYVAVWRETLFRRFLGSAWPFWVKNKTGALVYQTLTETERLGRAFYVSVQLNSLLTTMVLYILVALWLSWQFTVFLLIAFVLLGSLILGYAAVRSYRAGRDYGMFLNELQALITELYAGVKLVKATANEEVASEKMTPLLERVTV